MASISVSLDDPDDLFECALCLQTLNNPKLLPCGHSFCLSCLQDLHTSDVKKGSISDNQSRCPSDRRVHQLPPQGTNGLFPDHRTNKMIERQKITENEHQRFGEQSSQNIKCFLCQCSSIQRGASHSCLDCMNTLCIDCMRKHQQHPIWKKHLLLEISSETRKYLICGIHTKDVLCMFCTTCSCSVCNKCTSADHTDHNIVGFRLFDLQTDSSAAKVRNDLFSLDATLTQTRTTATNARHVNDQSRGHTKNAIDQHATLLHDQIENDRKRLHSEIDNHHSTIKTKIQNLVTNIDKQQMDVQKELDQIVNLLYPLGEHSGVVPDDVIDVSKIKKSFNFIKVLSVPEPPEAWKFGPKKFSKLGIFGPAADKRTRFPAERDNKLSKHAIFSTRYRYKNREAKTINQNIEVDNATSMQHVDICPICMCPPTNPQSLPKCKHRFCKTCIDESFRQCGPKCPTCGEMYGIVQGTQPRYGQMRERREAYAALPGYRTCGTIVIGYAILNGTQGPEYPTPGKCYRGTKCIAYLPDNKEGNEILALLRKAYNARLIFTIGRSAITGLADQVIWADIPHKTSRNGGISSNGYPDPTYLQRVRQELAAKGIQ